MSINHPSGSGPLGEAGWSVTRDWNPRSFAISDRRTDLHRIILCVGNTEIALPEDDWMTIVAALEDIIHTRTVKCPGCEVLA